MTNDAHQLPKAFSEHMVDFDPSLAARTISYLQEVGHPNYVGSNSRSHSENLALILIHTIIREIAKSSPDDVGVLAKLSDLEEISRLADSNDEKYIFTELVASTNERSAFFDRTKLSPLAHNDSKLQIAYEKRDDAIDRILLNFVQQEPEEDHVRSFILLSAYSLDQRHFQIFVPTDKLKLALVCLPFSKEMIKLREEEKLPSRPAIPSQGTTSAPDFSKS